MVWSAPSEDVGSADATAVGVSANASAAAHSAARIRPLYVAVQCHVDRPADDDGDEATALALVHPEGSGLRLRVANARDETLVQRCIPDPIDDDVVTLVLQSGDRLVRVALLGGLRRGEPGRREHDAHRRYRCCHTPACAHDSLHSVVAWY